MSEPSVNPYESPFTDDARSFVRVEDPQSVAELQERVRKLEEQLKANWLWGPTWKRALAVFGYFIIGYFVIAVIGYSIFGLVMAALYFSGAMDF